MSRTLHITSKPLFRRL